MGKDCEDGKKGLLNPEALVKEAKASKYREAYKTLDSSLSYRIGVGVRLRSSENYSFFIEALFYCALLPELLIWKLLVNV
ncbi:MAG: hypothetical protein QXU11_07170 [Thermoproteota archaeon]